MSHELSSSDPPLVSIVIVSRNRRDELARAIASCFAQRGVSLEVLVIDDASEDDTSRMVAESFPHARLFTFASREGLIVRRNIGFREARGKFVMSLDDDAYFSEADTLRLACQLLNDDEQTAACALKYIEPSCQSPKPAPRSGTRLRSYIGCSHIVRTDVARLLNGYPEFLVHQGEERDLCIRMLDQGWDIRFVDSPAIVHLCSVHRDRDRIGYYGYRNQLIFNWMRVPTRFLWGRMLIDIIQLAKYQFSFRHLRIRLAGLGAGMMGIIRYWNQRKPVSVSTYEQFRSLDNHGPSEFSGPVPGPINPET